MKRFATFAALLKANRSGVAMTEFAMSLPLLLGAGLYGTETANFALVNMRVSQVAMHLADNASRIGDTSTLINRKVFERDIDDLLIGSNIQAGPSINFYEHGRAIISSLEVWNQSVHCSIAGGCPSGAHSNGVQFIHWQRCLGKKVYNSSYGVENQAMPSGIGPTGEEVMAPDDGAVIFVEVAYDYQPLISNQFLGAKTIKSTAAFIVRDSRDLSEIKQRNTSSPDAVAVCSNNTGVSAVMS